MNTLIASGPVIIENNKVLLNQHGDDAFWKFPGGRIEDDQDFADEINSLEQACQREFYEEMGCECEIIKPLKPMMIKKDENTRVILIHYLARRQGKIKPGADIRKWDWHDLGKLPSDLAKNILPVLTEYQNHKA